MENATTAQTITLTVFGYSFVSNFLIFQFCIFEFRSLKMFLICSYFLTNFNLVVLIKFVLIKKCILSTLLQAEISEIAT